MERIFYAINNRALAAKRPIRSTFGNRIIRRVRFCLRNYILEWGFVRRKVVRRIEHEYKQTISWKRIIELLSRLERKIKTNNTRIEDA